MIVPIDLFVRVQKYEKIFLCCMIAMPLYATHKKEHVYKTYMRSIIIGSAIGTATGVSNSFVNRYLILPYIPIGWAAAWFIRHEIIDLIIQDLQYHMIPHRSSVIHAAAWITSWISYIQSNVYFYDKMFYLL